VYLTLNFQTRENTYTRKTLHLPLLQQGILQIRQPSTVCPSISLIYHFLCQLQSEIFEHVVRVACQKPTTNPHQTHRQTDHHTTAALHNISSHRSKLCIEEAIANKSSYRHKRTHDRGDGVEGPFNLSGEDEEDYSGEDQIGSLEDASPTSEGSYVPASLNSAVNGSTPPSNGMGQMSHANSFNSLQTLSMPMTMSQPQAINAGGMM